MASIEFENVVKVYPGAKKPVVPNLNLKINDKEFIILVGPSGCGKSTTLRRIGGYFQRHSTYRWKESQ